MTCLSPSPTDADLFAYLDGDNSLAAHIAQCSVCQARVQALADEEHRLAQTFAHIDCPSPLELGEYELGLLPKSREKEIRSHLAMCPSCTKELAILQTYLTSGSPAPAMSPDIGETVRVLFAKLLHDVQSALQSPGGMRPAMAGIRGSEQAPRIYGAEEFQLAIQFQEDPEKPGRRALYGLLIGDEPDAFEVQIWQDDALVAHTPVDAHGNFSISGLQPGGYAMKLIRPKLAIRLDDLSIE